MSAATVSVGSPWLRGKALTAELPRFLVVAWGVVALISETVSEEGARHSARGEGDEGAEAGGAWSE